MNGEKTKKMVDSAIEDLAASLEEGKSESLKAYLAAMGRFHRYSVGNAILIATARPDATHVAGFRAWQRLGRQVRKGERGIAILAPIVHRKARTADRQLGDRNAGGAGKPDNADEYDVRAFRTAHVFDVAQTDGKALPELARVKGEPKEGLIRLRQHVVAQGIRLRYASLLGGTEDGLRHGRPSTGGLARWRRLE